MPNRSGLCILFGIFGVVACGGPSEDNFSDSPGVGGKATTGGSGAGKSASGGKGGGSGAGGTSGSSSAGKGGGSGTSGSAGAGGSTGGTGAETGGTGGTDTGGTGGTDTGGTGGTDTGGTGGTDTGGTTGTGGSTGGTGAETGGTGALGGMGAMAGSGTGGDGGTRAGAGGRGGNPPCVEHARAYSEAVEAARVCNADSGKDQCTKQVPSSLDCGCSVFVNPDNEEAMAELERLMHEIPVECIVLCPAIACLDPETADCVEGNGPNEGAGTCGPMLPPK